MRSLYHLWLFYFCGFLRVRKGCGVGVEAGVTGWSGGGLGSETATPVTERSKVRISDQWPMGGRIIWFETDGLFAGVSTL